MEIKRNMIRDLVAVVDKHFPDLNPDEPTVVVEALGHIAHVSGTLMSLVLVHGEDMLELSLRTSREISEQSARNTMKLARAMRAAQDELAERGGKVDG